MSKNTLPSEPVEEPRSSKSKRIFNIGVYIALVAIIGYATTVILQFNDEIAAATALGNKRINVAARQHVLAEKIVKTLLTYERESGNRMRANAALAELAESTELFNTTLRAFDGGGQVAAVDGSTFYMMRSDEFQEQRIIRDALDRWLPLQVELKNVAEKAPPVSEVAATIETARAELQTIGALMNELAVHSEATAERFSRKAEAPRTLFIAVDSIALVLLPGYLLWERMRRLRQKAEKALGNLETVYAQVESQASELESAKNETDLIMDTVQEGLLLVDENGIIGNHFSHALIRILRQERLAQTSLLSLLQRLLSEKMFGITRDYFDLLFNMKRKEKAVLQVNPLKDIEVNFPNPKGGFESRYLGFDFRRIVVNGKVERLFVTVRDVTAQVELERKLRESEKNKERQLEILLGILHVEPAELENFARLVENELTTINQTLRAEDFAASGGHRIDKLRERLNTVFRSVHNIKGNACYLRLDYFQKGAEAFESKISDLLDQATLSGDDFLAIVVAQAGLRADLNDLVELRKKLLGMRQTAPTTATENKTSVLADGLRDLVNEVAGELGKKVDLEVDVYGLNAVAMARQDLVRDVLIQLARNSLAHSIEPANERTQAGKPTTGRLSIRSLPRTAEGLVGIAFRDDGRGLGLDRIRSKAEASGLLVAGRNYAPAEIARCIFAPAFSTAAEAGAHSGRGMGMDIIKSKIVDEMGGAIEVRSAPGVFCEFHIYLPEITEPAAVA